MTIFSAQSNPLPMEQTEMSIRLETQTASIPQLQPSIDYCFCNYDCDFRQLVLAGATDYETDRSDFLVDIPDTVTGSFMITLINQSSGLETQLINNTFGTYFGLGTMSQVTKGGYLINWGLVRDFLGYGRYKVRIEQTFFGQTIETESHIYDLKPYDPEYADGTVRIETVRDGCIEGGIDYTGLEWLTQVRIPGKFGFKTPRLERDFYETNTRKVAQIQDKVISTYELRTSLLPSFISDALIEDGFMASSIFITDYNLISARDIRQLEVVATEYSEATEYYVSRKSKYVIQFEEKTQNLIKRN
jgi:hypothetical protein